MIKKQKNNNKLREIKTKRENRRNRRTKGEKEKWMYRSQEKIYKKRRRLNATKMAEVWNVTRPLGGRTCRDQFSLRRPDDLDITLNKKYLNSLGWKFGSWWVKIFHVIYKRHVCRKIRIRYLTDVLQSSRREQVCGPSKALSSCQCADLCFVTVVSLDMLTL